MIPLAGCSETNDVRTKTIEALTAAGATVRVDEDGKTCSVLFGPGAALTDTEFEHLRHLPSIRGLSFRGRSISDAQVEHLCRLDNLTTLILSDTPITDQALEDLKTVSSLRYVNLHGTKVTADGVTGFRQAMPDCRITW